eukprot:scaffold80431_cov59-Attheya_sp.AAC.2
MTRKVHTQLILGCYILHCCVYNSRMRHEDMCLIDDCIYCHTDRQPYREAEEIQKSLMSEYSTEGKKECTKDWKKNSFNYECHLCQATTETPK